MIEEKKDLKVILDGISTITSYFHMCLYLDIVEETCNKLKHDNDLNTFTISLQYMAQNPKSCWEKIIVYLCKDFGHKRLANKVANTYTVPQDYCDLCNEVTDGCKM